MHGLAYHFFGLHFGVGAGYGIAVVWLRHERCARIPDAVATISTFIALLTLARFLRLLLVAVVFAAICAATTAATAATAAFTLLFGGGRHHRGCLRSDCGINLRRIQRRGALRSLLLARFLWTILARTAALTTATLPVFTGARAAVAFAATATTTAAMTFTTITALAAIGAFTALRAIAVACGVRAAPCLTLGIARGFCGCGCCD